MVERGQTPRLERPVLNADAAASGCDPAPLSAAAALLLALAAYFASSRERLAAVATALRISPGSPSGAISTSKAAAVVPPGEVTLRRSCAASRSERWSSSPA